LYRKDEEKSLNIIWNILISVLRTLSKELDKKKFVLKIQVKHLSK